MKAIWRLSIGMMLVLASGCDREADITTTDGRCTPPLSAGDLIITEVMANPSSIDPSWGWIELYNSTEKTIVLDCITLVVSDANQESGEQAYTFGTGSMDPGAYLVIGGPTDAPPPEHIDIQHDGLSPLNSAAGLITIKSGDTLLDSAVYAEMRPGVAQGYNGMLTPSAAGNDQLKNWCEAMNAYGLDAFGSPGEANEGCSEVGHTCNGDGGVRDILFPEPGDLVITEVLADPSAVADAQGEWFEVITTADVDLNGLGIGTDVDDIRQTVNSTECLHFAAGEVIVFARSRDPEQNGGIDNVDVDLTFSLANDNSSIALTLGETLLDQVRWPGSPPTGVSLSLDPGATDALANDSEAAWCESVMPYFAEGDLGTPGEPNSPCPVVLEAGMCLEGNAARPIHAPSPGSIHINEFMANPKTVSDGDGEWIELAITEEIDLNGLTVGILDYETGETKSSTTLDSDNCLSVAAGDFVLLARNEVSELNGGLPEIDAMFSVSILNSDAGLFLNVGAARLDTVLYRGNALEAGSSRLLSADFDASLSELPVWCSAITPYGAGDRGTPGSPNPVCGADPEDDPESTPEGTDPDLPQDGTPDPSDDPTPTPEPSITEGMCLDGDTTRQITAPTVGTLQINEYMANPAAVSDTKGEWIELMIHQDTDLNGLKVGTLDYETGDIKSSVTLEGAECLWFPAGSMVLLARNADPALNGGLPDVDELFGFSVLNSDGGLFLEREGARLDTVLYAGNALEAGVSRMLSSGIASASSEDAEGLTGWCAGVTPYGDGDFGTPGSPNPACLGPGEVE